MNGDTANLARPTERGTAYLNGLEADSTGGVLNTLIYSSATLVESGEGRVAQSE